MGAESSDDQAHFNPSRCCCAARPGRNGGDHLRLRESFRRMKVWPPAQLKIGNVLCRFGLNQMLGSTIERLGVLQECDR